MKGTVLFLIVLALVATGFAGCGSNKTEVEELRAEQQRALDKIGAQLQGLSAEMRRVREQVSELDGDLLDLRGRVARGLAAVRTAEVAKGPTVKTVNGSGTTGADGEAEGVPVEEVEVNIDTLSEQLAKMQSDVATLRDEYTSDKELEELRDPRRTWEAMGDPEQLAARLDRFADTYAATIEDETQREEFLADMGTLKEEVEARGEMSEDERIQYYAAQLTEQINNAETNDRMRQWYQRQLTSLTTGDEEAIERQLEMVQRMDSSRAVGEVTSKYSISSQTLRDNGLQTLGRGMGGRRGRR